jgi:hypothetical protein
MKSVAIGKSLFSPRNNKKQDELAAKKRSKIA